MLYHARTTPRHHATAADPTRRPDAARAVAGVLLCTLASCSPVVAGDDGTVAVWSDAQGNVRAARCRPSRGWYSCPIAAGVVVVVSVVTAGQPGGRKAQAGDVIESVADAKGAQKPVKVPLDFVLAVRGAGRWRQRADQSEATGGPGRGAGGHGDRVPAPVVHPLGRSGREGRQTCRTGSAGPPSRPLRRERRSRERRPASVWLTATPATNGPAGHARGCEPVPQTLLQTRLPPPARRNRRLQHRDRA